jgi:hypothetical protein
MYIVTSYRLAACNIRKVIILLFSKETLWEKLQGATSETVS